MTSKVFLSLRVPADPARAFAVFTNEIAAWWRPDRLFAITPEGDGELSFEPGANGRLIARFPSGEIFEIGRILVWEPGRRLVFVWRQASFSPEQSTEVEVRFEPVGRETRVSVEHRAWDTIPERHAARHEFPEHVTLARAADWWRASLFSLRDRISPGT